MARRKRTKSSRLSLREQAMEAANIAQARNAGKCKVRLNRKTMMVVSRTEVKGILEQHNLDESAVTWPVNAEL